MSFLLEPPPEFGADIAPSSNYYRSIDTFPDPLFSGLPSAPALSQGQQSAVRAQMLSQHIPTSGSETSAIVTYVGQMIAHEIVPSTSLFPDLVVEPTMNLGSLYGHAGTDDPRPPIDSAGRFVLGKLPGDPTSGSDLARDRYSAKALIADPRNDENHLVSQMHATWLRFHNRMVDYALANEECDPLHYARQITVRAFQFVAVTDFLSQIISRPVYEHYLRAGPQILDSTRFTKIPDSFAFGAFRIGHSMVRNAYTLNRRRGRLRLHPMPELFARFRDQPFSAEENVDWRIIDQQPAGRIDCAIVHAMNRPPFDGTRKSIVEINLRQGQHLPPGYACAAHIVARHPRLAGIARLTPMPEDALESGRLRPLGLNIETLPLWLYLLQEASVSPGFGDSMGPLGSIIIAEVVFSSIQASTESVSPLLSQGFAEWCGWLGPFGRFLETRRPPQTTHVRFLDVFDFLEST
ncbi:MAG: peroxidase family protein [Pseudomonadota bacterium]